MTKQKVLLCVTGGIAAYKAIDLSSILIKQGYDVQCVLSRNATNFVGALSFAAITHNPVHVDMFDDPDPIVHISLADWADIIVVAPASANIIAKAAHGIADDLISTILLAHTKPVLYVPAMNVHMWEAKATQENAEILSRRDNHVLLPDTGMLACGYTGRGKYPSNIEIVFAIETYLTHAKDLCGKRVLISAGATIESIDPMRYISNRSSGKMGLALARAFSLRGALVTLVYANISEPIPHYIDKAISCCSAEDMRDKIISEYTASDWIIMCAAVADYRPVSTSETKLPKDEALSLNLLSTPDILKELGEVKQNHQKLIGFAAQTDNMFSKAVDKFYRKKLDMICVNNINVAGSDNSELYIIGNMAGEPKLKEDEKLSVISCSDSKFQIAHRIADSISKL